MIALMLPVILFVLCLFSVCIGFRENHWQSWTIIIGGLFIYLLGLIAGGLQ